MFEQIHVTKWVQTTKETWDSPYNSSNDAASIKEELEKVTEKNSGEYLTLLW